MLCKRFCISAGLDFVFHMFFLVKYSKSLEEGSFRGRSADFLWMLLLGESFCACITSPNKLHSTCQQGYYCAQYFHSLPSGRGSHRLAACEGCTRGWHVERTGRKLTFILLTAQHIHRRLEGNACSILDAQASVFFL